MIEVFPAKYEHVNRQISNVLVIGELLGGEGNADFFARMKNGQCYSFTAFTPDNVKSYMQAENENAFVSPGLVLVRQISIEAILDALETCLGFLFERHIPLTHFGTLQMNEQMT